MNSNDNYKAKMLRALKLKSQGALAIYEMTRLAVEIFDDADFRLDHGNADDFRCADVLDDQLFAEFGWSFFDLRRMLQKFPEKKHWQAGKLRHLYEEVAKSQVAESEPRKPVQRATLKEVSALQDQVKSLETQRKFGEQLLDQRSKEVDELLAENSDLKREIATLKGRIMELEQQLKLAAVSA